MVTNEELMQEIRTIQKDGPRNLLFMAVIYIITIAITYYGLSFSANDSKYEWIALIFIFFIFPLWYTYDIKIKKIDEHFNKILKSKGRKKLKK